MNEVDFLYNPAPICPYCKHEVGDAWEIDFPDTEAEIECDRCGKEFTVTREVCVTYSTRKIKPSEPYRPVELNKFYDPSVAV